MYEKLGSTLILENNHMIYLRWLSRKCVIESIVHLKEELWAKCF